MKTRLLLLVLCVCLCISLLATACTPKNTAPEASSVEETSSQEVVVDTSLSTIDFTYDPLMAGDEKLLYNNPDRGFRTEMVFTIFDKHPDPENSGQYNDHCDLIKWGSDGRVYYNYSSKCSGKHDVRYVYANLSDEEINKTIEYLFQIYFPTNAECQSKLGLVFVSFNDYNKGDLPDRCLEVLQLLFNRYRKQGAKMLWRHSYGSPWLNWKVNEAYKEQLAKECADQETMFRHIDQLAPLFAKNLDVIHKFSSGFIGNGEFTENWQWPPIDTNALIKKVLETWCVPNNLYYTVRMPSFKLRLETAEPDYEYLHLIGNNNDAIFGEQTNGGWNSACFQINHNNTAGKTKCTNGIDHVANSYWEYLYEHAAFTPQSGEMYVNSNHISTNRVPTGMEVILELAHHRYTSFSQWHCFLEKGNAGKGSVIDGWIKNEDITPEILDNELIVFDPNWFIDINGNQIDRNPYEFIRDHLGYKVTITKATITDNFVADGAINIDLKLFNYGFAAAFNMKSGFAILDEDYNVVSTVEAGEPEKWYSHDPYNHRDNEVLEHTVSANIKLPSESGKYHIAFYLKSITDDFAHLSNDPDSVAFVGDGYNILHTVEY